MKEFEFEWVKTEKGNVVCIGDICVQCEDEPGARELAKIKLKNIVMNDKYLTLVNQKEI